MKFVISTQELNYLINKIQNVVPQKPTIPVLTNFLIEASKGELILTATDLTVGIRCSTEVNILQEGSTTLPAKRLGQLVRELTTSNVEISSNANETTTVIAGTSRFKINGLSKEDFPSLPDLTQAQTIQIKQKDLKDLLYRTSFAVSKDDNRYVLTGLLMQISKGEISFAGTDGKRLARAKTQIEISPDIHAQAIIPLKAVDEIIKNLTDEGEVKISLMGEKMAVEINQTLILTKLLAGDYPDIAQVIPKNSEIIVSLHREELISLLRQISLFTADHNHSVRFIFDEGELKLTANTMDIGEGHVSMPADYHGKKLDIAFNPGFFIDILRHCKEETIALGLTDSFNPGLILDGEKTEQLNQATPLFVIMPMRLPEG